MITMTCLILWMPAGGAGFRYTSVLPPRLAAQFGPIWLLCLRSTLRSGVRVGIAIGAGAAVIDVAYAALGVAGASRLAFLGLRTLWSAFRVRLGGEAPDEVDSPRRAFLTSLGATASNPMTIVSWAAIFSAASTGNAVGSSTGSALVLLGGVCVGSFVWFSILSAAVAWSRRRGGPRLVAAIDAVSALAIVGFAGLLGYRTLSDA